jgi:dihydrodipicolinate synthase/N-acetylneuraminate lyase
VYGYSIPSEAKNRISAGLLKNLGKLTNFAGAKVSITSPEAVRELVKASGGRMRIYSGSDATALQGLRAGGHGLVSGPSSAVPEPYIALADAVAAGDDERAKAAHKLIERLARDIGGGIGRIKFALAVRGLPSGHLRAHLPRPSVEDRRQIEDAVESVVEAARNLDPEPHTPTRSSSTGRT